MSEFFHEQFRDLMREVADLKRRMDNTVRHGKVTDVDAKEQRVRIAIGGTDDEPQKSPWIPYAQIAGAVKLHTPPSKGQQMTLLAPTGDARQAVALPLTWSDENKSPSDKPDEHVLTFENVSVTMKKDSLKFTVGDSSIEITKDKIVELAKTSINLKSETVHTVGKTHLGVESLDEKATPRVETDAGEAKQTFAKV